MRLRTIIGVPLALLLLLALIQCVQSDFWAIDRCLDGGGRWNKEKRECEGSRY